MGHSKSAKTLAYGPIPKRTDEPPLDASDLSSVLSGREGFSSTDYQRLLDRMTAEMRAFRSREGRWLTEMIRETDRVCEIGTGPDGRILRAILKAGVHPLRIEAVEIDLDSLRTCQTRFPAVRICHGIFPQWRPVNLVDVVTIAGNTLGNQLGQEQVWLRAAASCLTPSGRLLVGLFGEHGREAQIQSYRRAGFTPVPSPQGFSRRVAFTKEGIRSRRYTEREIRDLVRGAGLHVATLRRVSMGWLVEIDSRGTPVGDR